MSVADLLSDGLQRFWQNAPASPLVALKAEALTMAAGKQDKKGENEKPAASNPSGSGFSASLCPASIFALFSPAIPPAGRCNLLAFTPRQRMSELTATDRCPQGNRVATICMTTTGRRAAPLGAARVKCGMSHCNILLQRARAYQPTICRQLIPAECGRTTEPKAWKSGRRHQSAAGHTSTSRTGCTREAGSRQTCRT